MSKLITPLYKDWDIGGTLDLASSIFVIDLDTGCIFYLYDDRGLYLFALKEDYLTDVWNEFYNDVFSDWNLSCKTIR